MPSPSPSPSPPPSPAAVIWSSLGLPEDYLLRHLKLVGNTNTVVDSSFRIGEAAQTSVGLAALGAVYFHQLRNGTGGEEGQDVSVDARHAVLEFNSHKYYTVNGEPYGKDFDPLMGLYKTKGNGYVRLHTNFPHHRRGILQILNIPDTPEVTKQHVQNALLQQQWNALDFERVAAEKEEGVCAFALRSFEQWDATPQAKALRGVPPVFIRKVGEAPKRKRKRSVTPLEGVRVLDLSRVLAGPVAGRTLAAHGADVLLVTSEKLPGLPGLDVDTSRGKRTTRLDLDLNGEGKGGGREKLRELVAGADVFLQAYRPGALEGRGFGVGDVVRMRGGGREHGIVCANLCAWGWEGPWKGRRGFDSLVQTASGLNVAEAEAYAQFTGAKEPSLTPKPFPVQALDYSAGYLLAFGINAALCKTVTEGGSWEVNVSLAAVGQWVRSLGRIEPEVAFGRGVPLPKDSNAEEIQKLSVDWRGRGGEKVIMRALKHPAVLEKTPVREGREGEPGAPVVLDKDEPEWVEQAGM
ncbi:hypothetical protein PQX77_016218 [Marasmius sp. AFHP31]|nr:hypothetical protein PQX77_016218 [Marasmius sp. AFHP31]